VRRALALAGKEWRMIARSDLLYLVVIQPLVFCFVWGYCVSTDVESAPLVVLDASASPEGRALVTELESSRSFTRVRQARTVDELSRSLMLGEASVGLIVPARFPEQLRRKGKGEVQLLVDGTDPVIATLGRQEALGVLTEAAVTTRRARERKSSLRYLYNPGLRSAASLLLAAICFNLTWFLVYPTESLLRERQAGTLEALRATPLRAHHLYFGLAMPHLTVALWGSLFQVALAVLLVGVPLRASLATLVAGLSLYGLAHINLGVLLGVLVRGFRQVAVLHLLFAVFSMAFSGFLLPLQSLPRWAQAVAQAVPLTHGLRFMRAAFLKGDGFAELSPSLIVIGAFAFGTTLVALRACGSLMREGLERA
jgi:ABC-2 type transport system permease protein